MKNLCKTKFLLHCFLLFFSLSFSQQAIEKDPILMKNLIEDLVSKGFKEHLFPGIGVALYQNDSLKLFHKGYSKLSSNTKINNSTKFQLGSIGKVLTAIAVLQQSDAGTLQIEKEISNYIYDDSQQFKGVSLKCLITHTCGFNDINIGYLAKDQNDIIELEEFVFDSYPGFFQNPNLEINYSNYSYALAGYIIEKVTGISFPKYIEQNIFEPLAMEDSSLIFPNNYQTDATYSTGYKKVENEFTEVQIYPRHAISAGSLISTTEDMGLFIKALYEKNNSLLSEKSWNLLFSRQFSNHELLNGYSFGLEEQNINGYQSWSKGGMLPGMLSNINIVPNKYALFTVVNTDDDLFGELFQKSLHNLNNNNQVELRKIKSINTDRFVGNYRDKRYNHNTEENIVSLFRSQLNIYQNLTKDSLLIHHNGKWNYYIPVDELIFQNVELPYEYLVFNQNHSGKITTLYRNGNISGLSIPLSYEKTKWFNNPQYINEYYGFIFLIILIGIFVPLTFVIKKIIKWISKAPQKFILSNYFHIIFSVAILLIILHTFLVPFQLLTKSNEFLFGYPSSFQLGKLLGLVILIIVILNALKIISLWRYKKGNLKLRMFISLVIVAMVIHLCYLEYWNLFLY